MLQLSKRLFAPVLLFSVVYAGCFRCDIELVGISATYPEDASYSSFITPFNPRYIYKPAAFTFPSTAQQIAQVVELAIKNDLHVAARSGGHSYISNSLGGRDGEVIVDLRNLTNIEVDPQTHVATIESGNRLGSVVLGLNKFGRATPHGTCPDVGMGGHTSYGGSGYVNRQWGLAIDAIESMDIVLANGTFTRASENENSDLFWAMRGAGGSFGITTAFYMKTYPVPASVTYFLYWYFDLTVAEAIKAISAYQSFMLSGPPSTFGMNLVIGANKTPGTVYLFITGALYDESAKFNATVKPLLDAFPDEEQLAGRAKMVNVRTGSYVKMQELMGVATGSKSLTDTANIPYRSFTKSLMTPEKEPMTEAAIAALVQWFAYDAVEAKLDADCLIEAYGGPNSYMNQVPLDSMAFAHRDSLFTFECGLADPRTSTQDSQEAGYQYIDDVINTLVKNMPDDWDYGAYPNYIDDRLKDWQKRYYGPHYRKLQQIKKKYDPKNMFRAPIGIELPHEPKCEVVEGYETWK